MDPAEAERQRLLSMIDLLRDEREEDAKMQ
jgi:hypothetical protein